jgi:5'-phosphate synthase pdxT subunit
LVRIVTIGVLSFQGAVSEQLASFSSVFKGTSLKNQVKVVRRDNDLDNIDALVIPGGESTTIARALSNSRMAQALLRRIQEESLPIMGTCAGCVLLAKVVDKSSDDIFLLKAMNIQVRRNAFGRQRESFEVDIDYRGFSTPYHAVFIRAPIINKVWGDAEVLATIDEKIIAAREKCFLALSFHPELTTDERIHRYFLEMID